MNRNTLKQTISECCNDITFFYNGKSSGVTSEVKDYVPLFQAWHGDSVKMYDDIDDVMRDRFYSGKSLDDLVETININVV